MGRTRVTCKMCRREKEKICDSHKCAFTRRNYPPGQHGPGKPTRLSTYGKQLRMKQKAKRMYGLRERQFHNLFTKAAKSARDVGEHLVSFLESRLDNVVYRLGLATTRSQARQLVCHAHFSVNGKKVNIPSFAVSPDDEIALCEPSREKAYFKELRSGDKAKRPAWLMWDWNAYKGKVLKAPNLEEVKRLIEPTLIVEYYSK